MREAAARTPKQLSARRAKGAASVAILIAAALLVGACGEDEPAPEPPALAKQVGQTLSERADEIVRQLERGRRCAAADEVRDLREVAERQTVNDRIPAELREPLLTGVDALLGRIDCPEKVTETVTIPSEPEIVTTTETEPPEETTNEDSGGSEPPPQDEGGSGGEEPPPPDPGSGDSGSGEGE
jgi:hypothetical protein